MYTADTALTLVKARLNRLDTALDSYLSYRIAAAAEYLEGKGIDLIATDEHPADLLLLVDTTVHQYRNVESGEAEPEWLRNRIFERWSNPPAEESEDA